MYLFSKNELKINPFGKKKSIKLFFFECQGGLIIHIQFFFFFTFLE